MQRYGLDLEGAEVDAQGGVGGAVERGDLVEQAGLGADPVVLDARAEPGDVHPIELGGVGGAEIDQGEGEGDLERGG